jgi:hypothetical protein
MFQAFIASFICARQARRSFRQARTWHTTVMSDALSGGKKSNRKSKIPLFGSIAASNHHCIAA